MCAFAESSLSQHICSRPYLRKCAFPLRAIAPKRALVAVLGLVALVPCCTVAQPRHRHAPVTAPLRRTRWWRCWAWLRSRWRRTPA